MRLAGSANPTLTLVSITDKGRLHIEEVIDERNPGHLQINREYPLRTIRPDGRTGEWWRLSRATSQLVPALVIVPLPPLGHRPYLLATFDETFSIDQPCVYEASLQRAARLLDTPNKREVIAELLRRHRAGDGLLPEVWRETPCEHCGPYAFIHGSPGVEHQRVNRPRLP